MKNSIYGKTVCLNESLSDVECWNFIDRSLHVITAGAKVRIEHVSDETRTVVMLVDEKGDALGVELVRKDGIKQMGYRFIVDNVKLAKATGLKMPKKTRDIVAEMMAWESGDLDDNKTLSLFRKLKKDGLLSGLQGCYGRAAARLGV